MSDPENISPLLDGFTLGAPISEHHGVVCHPAIKENSNKKYIVKILTIPASQSQFDALLLAGAYKDPGDAMEYFRENGETILKEAELLKNLSKIEGFLPYDGWQMEPITRRRLGYHVYLVGSYKRSLEKYIQKNAITHLQAVNLALDLCSALSVCRQAGYLYVDLKPNNIYVSEKKEYRIGDLGFLSLDALRYASLPERYFSPYTPPELLDPMTPMNLSVDTYAVGMILYQLYNDGHLPFTGFPPPEALPNPCHADYEMAEIIMKAIHPDPEQRWTDPKDLGKAIASYLQRNSINDIPITPFTPIDVKPEDIAVVSSAKQEEQDISAEQEDPTAENVPAEESECAVQDTKCEQNSSAEADVECPIEETADVEGKTADVEEEPADTEQEPTRDAQETPAAAPAIATEEPVTPESAVPPVCEASNPQAEETLPEVKVSEDIAKILSRADSLIAHEIPVETAFPEEPPQPDPFSFVKEDTEDTEDSLPEEPPMEEETADTETKKKKKTKHFENPSRKTKFKKFFSLCFVLLLLSAGCIGGFWYYRNVYLQTIDSISLSGTQDQITVLIDTGVEESMLMIHCIDENGKRQTESVQGGKAVFSNLTPNTRYTIQADMSGFHKLVGNTSDVFTTEANTQILSFQAIAGSEDGSVQLEFTVNGKDPDFWNIRYCAEGETEQVETVTRHSAMITGLTIGKVYTFTLDGGKNFDLSGETSIQYLASRLILAEDLTVTSDNGSDLTVTWKTPGDVVVDSWNVRCFDGYGFEEQLTVTEPKVLFTGMDPASNYTVEITASGMTQPSRISITADSIHVSDFQVDESGKTEMKITWQYSGDAPEGGWLLTYTVDGSGSQVVQCEKASAKIAPLIPGANYAFTLQSADSRTILNNTVLYTTKDAEPFTEQNFRVENVTVDLLKTPEEAVDSYETLSEDAFTDTFQVGDSASILLRSSSSVYLPSNKTKLLFVFRDSYGNVLPELVSEVTCPWKDIWFNGDKNIGELDIPKLPSTAGTYQLDLFFNGGKAASVPITMAE